MDIVHLIFIYHNLFTRNFVISFHFKKLHLRANKEILGRNPGSYLFRVIQLVC